jgi:hypothetical protein
MKLNVLVYIHNASFSVTKCSRNTFIEEEIGGEQFARAACECVVHCVYTCVGTKTCAHSPFQIEDNNKNSTWRYSNSRDAWEKFKSPGYSFLYSYKSHLETGTNLPTESKIIGVYKVFHDIGSIVVVYQ